MAITPSFSQSQFSQYMLCGSCNLLVSIGELADDQHAQCPRCHHHLKTQSRWNLKRCAIIAIAILILLPFALYFPLLSVNLLGVEVNASIWGGVWKMATEGYPYTAFLVFLTAIFVPICFPLLVLILWLSQYTKYKPRLLLIALGYIKPWVMFDVYLVALGVSAFKVQDYATLKFNSYLIAFIATQLLIMLLFIKINLKVLWQEFYPLKRGISQKHLNLTPHFCRSCEYTFHQPMRDRLHSPICPRCHSRYFNIGEDLSLQNTWAFLIAGMVMLIPANIYPISYTFMNNVATGDTLISGVITFLGMGSYFVAFIVFVASIFVPISKVFIMLYLLLTIHFHWQHSIKWQMRLLHIVHFVGRWSMLDLFVLALMMSLVTRGQIINFSVGPAAIYFGAAVFLTMLATTFFDSRLLWIIYDRKQELTTNHSKS